MFGHLQVYSCYSFFNSTIMIKDLVREAKAKHIDALTLCDIDNMYGVIEFYKECLNNDITPILGLQASIMVDEDVYPFIIIARDDVGYLALIKISSYINTNDRGLDINELTKYLPHIYIISGNDNGIIERFILKEEENKAKEYLIRFKKLFNDNYYIMIQNHNINLQNYLNKRIIAIANYLNIKVVWSNEVRYLHKQDALALDLLHAYNKGNTITINHEVNTNQKYLKTKQEIEKLFDKEILEETSKLINNCKASIVFDKPHLPKYPMTKNYNSYDYLQSLCKFGLKKRFKNKNIEKRYIERLYYELKVIHEMNFEDYFLIVYDYVKYAKMNHIQVGPGRGSGAGSLVAYVLGITNIDPIKYNLLFERFLNPERVSMPDIDIDFQDNRREEVIDYVINKYGKDHAALIVAFSVFGARNTIREIGKVMGIAKPKLEMIAKMINNGKYKASIKETYNTSSSFQKIINNDERLRKVLYSLTVIEKLPRNITTHPAGVVLCDKKLEEVVPITKVNDHIISQYSKDYIEDVGLLKMDFLGVRNLTLIDYILKNIKEYQNIKLSLLEIPLDDKKTYDLFLKGDTFGIFQFESRGMTRLIMQYKPTNFDDLVALNAIYRPGPMQNIDEILQRRNGNKEVTYIFDDLKDILEPTYGFMIYQEQVMIITQRIAGFSLGKADILRKAISKKEESLMKSLKTDFIEGSIKNGYNKEKALELYEMIEKFANYGFNKSHSVAYSMISYQLAYLKANYPLYFYGAMLSIQNSNIRCIQEAKRNNIKILPPSINKSLDYFNIENNNIRFPLTGIKNISKEIYKSIKLIRDQGEFKDIKDFFVRVYKLNLKDSVIESLIDSGALDEFRYGRLTLKSNIGLLKMYAFVNINNEVEEDAIINPVYEDDSLILENERNVLGMYLSRHPIGVVKNKCEVRYINVNEVNNYINKNINIIIKINKIFTLFDKNGNAMAFIDGYDEFSHIDCTMFNQTYEKYKDILSKKNIYLVKGKVRIRNKLSFLIDDIEILK